RSRRMVIQTCQPGGSLTDPMANRCKSCNRCLKSCNQCQHSNLPVKPWLPPAMLHSNTGTSPLKLYRLYATITRSNKEFGGNYQRKICNLILSPLHMPRWVIVLTHTTNGSSSISTH